MNHECRNFSGQASFDADLKTSIGLLEKFAGIESVRKLTPELTRSLMQLKHSLQTMYEKESNQTDIKMTDLGKRFQF